MPALAGQQHEDDSGEPSSLKIGEAMHADEQPGARLSRRWSRARRSCLFARSRKQGRQRLEGIGADELPATLMGELEGNSGRRSGAGL